MDEMDLPVLLHTQDYRVDIVTHAEDPLQDHMDSKPKQTDFKWQFDNDFRYTEVDEHLRNNFSSEEIKINGWSNLPSNALESHFNDAHELTAQSKGPARTICNPLEAWLLLLDEPLLTIVLQRTNSEIRTRRGKGTHQRATDLLELRAWFGLNYLAGIFRNSTNPGPLEELWSLELGNAVFRVTMSLQRYEFLASCVRLSSKSKAENLESVWKKFIVNCRSYYSPCTYVVMDEDAKNEELLLCDAQSLYLHNKIKVENKRNSPLEGVYELVSDLKGSGRIVINETKYTSLEMAELMKSFDLALVGELNKSNKCEELETLTNECYRQTMYKEHLTLYEGRILSSNLASRINAKELFETTHGSCKKMTANVQQYDTYFGSPVRQQSNKFLQDVHTLLNYAAHNAWILLRLSAAEEMSLDYRDFLRCLGLYLTQQHLRQKLEQPEKLSLPQKVFLSEMLDEPLEKLMNGDKGEQSQVKILPVPEGIVLKSRIAEKRTRCRKCKGKNSPKTRTRCQQCLRSLCHRHIVFRCDECTGVTIDLNLNKQDYTDGIDENE